MTFKDEKLIFASGHSTSPSADFFRPVCACAQAHVYASSCSCWVSDKTSSVCFPLPARPPWPPLFGKHTREEEPFESQCLRVAKQPPLSVVPHQAAKSAGWPAAASSRFPPCQSGHAGKTSCSVQKMQFLQNSETDWKWEYDGSSVIVKEVEVPLLYEEN